MYVEGIASGGGSDWFYIAVIHAPNGAAVHVDDGDEDIDATVASGDYIGIPVHNQNSTYTITVTMNGLAAPDQTFTTGSTSGQMIEKTFEFAEIDITYDDEFRGQTLTITDGTHTPSPAQVVPSTGNNLVLRVPYTGNWHISAVDPVSGDTFYTSPDPIAITSLSQTVSCHLFVIPDGKTVLPTDDIEKWLECANIKGKSYTTLAEVLADEDTLRKLLTDDNAIDYLKRSTTWADVGGKVPKMTDNTHPSGEAIRINGYGSEGDNFSAYCSFNENNSDGACVSNDGIIAYHFTSAITIGKVRLFTMNNANIPSTVQVVASHDGTNWVNIGSTNSTPNQSTEYIFDVPGDTDYEYWGIKGSGASVGYWRIAEIQFYELSIPSSELAMSYIGAYDYAAETLLGDSTWNTAILGSTYASYVVNASVPTMTDNTHPSGEAISSPIHQSYYAYYAFDKNNSTFFGKQQNYANPYVGYEFVNSVIINKVYIRNSEHSANVSPNLALKGSPDGTNWTLITNLTLTNVGANAENTFEFVNADAYKYIAIFSLDTLQYWNVAELQFYGREAAGVQTWLKAAGLDRPYTTLAEVLADHNALAALMSSHDAVDYLVTVKSWINAITADETAMRYIGRRNYAADTLLADEDWLNAIVASSYVDYVLNAIIPLMTDNTHPSGEASVCSAGAPSTAYMAFDNVSTNNSAQALTDTGADQPNWLQYDFGSNVDKIFGYKFKMNSSYSSNNATLTFKVSDDGGSTFTDVDSQAVSPASDFIQPVSVSNKQVFRWYFNKGVQTFSSGGSTIYFTYIKEAQVYGRNDVDETTIDIFSAASDTVYYIDPVLGSQVTVATTDTSGKATIQKSNLPDGEYTLYSTVAKDPNNLSDPYHKRVSVDSDTMDVMVMPDNVIYWYGNKYFCDQLSAANGWNLNYYGWSSTDGGVTFNTYDVTLHGYANSICAGIGSKHKIKASIMKMLAYTAASHGHSYMIANQAKETALGNNYIEMPQDSTYQWVSKHMDVDDYYIADFSCYNTDDFLKALYAVGPNPLANFFGAANDTVYYMSGGVQVVFAETNELGEAVVDYSKLTPGSYTLISSVAKDPDNLSNPYSKIVTVDGNPIYFMPDNALYWWGWMSPNCEVLSTTNGWSGRTFVDPTFNANYISFVSASGNASGIGNSNSAPNGSTIHTIAKGITIGGTQYGLVGANTSKDLTSSSNTSSITTTSNEHVTYSMLSNGYIFAVSLSGRAMDVYALWYD